MELIERLKASMGTTSLQRACQLAADRVFSGRPKYRCDLSSMCVSAGIPVRYEDNVQFEGKLEYDEDLHPTITLRSGCRDQRRRFTLAHELGHWITHEVLNERTQSLFRGLPVAGNSRCEEETLADCLAAELLMPSESVAAFVARPVSHDVLDEGTDFFDVSRQAFARRLSDLKSVSLMYVEALPATFDDRRSRSIIDDGWLVEPRSTLIPFQRGARFAFQIPFISLGQVAMQGITVKVFQRELHAICDVRVRPLGPPSVMLLGQLTN